MNEILLTIEQVKQMPLRYLEKQLVDAWERSQAETTTLRQRCEQLENGLNRAIALFAMSYQQVGKTRTVEEDELLVIGTKLNSSFDATLPFAAQRAIDQAHMR
jgi:hypothetical protein